MRTMQRKKLTGKKRNEMGDKEREKEFKKNPKNVSVFLNEFLPSGICSFRVW